jgi:hypothetical protein
VVVGRGTSVGGNVIVRTRRSRRTTSNDLVETKHRLDESGTGRMAKEKTS